MVLRKRKPSGEEDDFDPFRRRNSWSGEDGDKSELESPRLERRSSNPLNLADFRLENSRQLLLESVRMGGVSLQSLAASSEASRRLEEALRDQSQTIAETRTLVSKIKGWLRQLERMDIMLFLGILFFVFVCMYILNKRLP